MSISNPSASLPTKYGAFNIIVWSAESGQETVALITPHLDITKPVLVRIHSECMTGDVFGSLRCDCGQQKQHALKKIADSKNGVFIYLRQEGRGIGLSEKIRSYALQEQGYDTHEANILLGHEPDPREYSMVKVVLDHLHVKDIKLITNNPSKDHSLREFGFNIVGRVPSIIKSNKYNKKYLETKKVKFKHFNDENYIYNVTGITEAAEVLSIVDHLRNYKLDPYMRIGIGFSATNTILTDHNQLKAWEQVFHEAIKHHPPLIPILHYSFKNSSAAEYKNEILQIAHKMPYLKKLQLNDLESKHLSTLSFASKYFTIHFPINEKLLHLISDPRYGTLVRTKHIHTLLDNSGGRGIPENIASFEKKISLCLNNGINNIGLAGGFGPNNLQTYFQLKNYFKINFSVDAETNLKMNGKINSELVNSYLDKLIMPQS